MLYCICIRKQWLKGKVAVSKQESNDGKEIVKIVKVAYLDCRRVPVVHLPGMLLKRHVRNKSAATVSLYQGGNNMAHMSMHF